MVRNGIDRLESHLEPLRRARLGVITNHTGLTATREPLIDLSATAGACTVGALFSPEHGIQGRLDEHVPDSIDERTGLPIYSLYGERKKPALQQLAGVDALLFDIQDIGARYYTYISTMGLAMEAAAERKIPFYVLDRVNPIGGQVEGPLADPDRLSFTAYHTIALRHGMTVGELAQMFNMERGIGADLTVIPCEGWKRQHDLRRLRAVLDKPVAEHAPPCSRRSCISASAYGRRRTCRSDAARTPRSSWSARRGSTDARWQEC
jgi:uncharacterized protein YbbC (DUF1343 family)